MGTIESAMADRLRTTMIPGVQQTSIAALRKHEDKLLTVEQRIVNYLANGSGIHTRAEIAEALGIATATCSGRVNALLQKGSIVREPGRYFCTVTGNRVQGVCIA